MLVSGSVVVLSFKGCIKNTKDLTHCRHFGCTGILSPPQKKHRNHWQKDTWLLGVQVSKRLMRKNDNFLWLQPSFKGYRHASFRQVVDIRESITNRWPLSQQMEEKKDMRTSYTKILSHGHSNVKYLVCIWILQPLRTHFFEVPKRITSPNTQCIYIYISNFQRCWHMLFFPTCIFFLPPKKPLTKATVCSTLFFKGSCWPRTFPSNKGPWPEATTVGTKSSTFPSWKSLGNPLLVVGCNILILA